MDTKFQTSFIPKKPVVVMADAPIYVKKPINLVSLISTGIFVLALLATGGVFLYERYITDNINRLSQELISARKAFETDLFSEFVRIDQRINTAEQILSDHVAISLFLDSLQEMAVREVRFKDLDYKIDEGGTIRANLRGEAKSYNAIAQQSEIFNNNKYITDSVFSDLDLDEKGNVVFSLAAGIDKELIAHKNGLQALTFMYDLNDNAQ